MYTLEETVGMVNDLGIKKVHKSLTEKLILSFIAGATVAFGYITYLKVADAIGGGLGVFVGASLFPIGLMIVLMAGGELLTGNMMVVGTAWLNKKVSFKEMILNWTQITIGNFLGSIFVALVFVMYLGLIDPEMPFLTSAAISKVDMSLIKMVVSGIGCNWFVGLSVWMYLGAKDGFLKFMGIWFPITVFVILGFQHCVANMFLLTMPLMLGTITLMQYVSNIGFVLIGNALGGVLFVGLLYSIASGSLKD